MKLRRTPTVLLAGLVASMLLIACGGSPNGSDAGATKTSPTATATASTAPTKGGADAGEVVFAHSASITQIVKLPQTLAVQEMAKEGYKVKQQYLATTTDSINAVIRGSATLGNTAPANFFAAVSNGADIVAIAGGGRPDYEVVGRPGVNDICKDAQRVAINNPVSTTDLVMRLYVAECPGGGKDKQILAVPLTPNRINALLANQIDVAPVQLFTVPLINRKYQGKLTLISNVAETYPNQISTLTFVKRSTLEARPKAIYDFVKAQQKVIEAGYADPQTLVDATKELVPSVPAVDAKAAIELYLKAQVFPRDGGISAQGFKTTYDQLRSTGLLKGDKEIDPEKFVDRSFIDLLSGLSG